ncbi:MAG: conjugal transfer protein TraL [Oscillospiraceae bacterium]|nr:conjugal transfer protein TraL [Oscillospiraceae bacterium]
MNDMTALSGLVLLGALGFLILWREGVLSRRRLLFLSAALLFAAMTVRALCMDHETLDYQNFLTVWVNFFRENGGFAALRESVGNYNVPYLYFLALFSYSAVRDLYLIKLLSICFDVLLAWGTLRLAEHFSKSAVVRLAAFFITLLLPTVVLNGAYWGQCDSIYAAFTVWSIYFALRGRGIRAVAAAALSFAFKLQAVFLLPVFLIFLFAKKIKWRHLAVFPLTYFLAVLPAVALGRPLADTVLLYFDQAGSVGSALNYNSPSIFAFVRGDVDAALLSALGVGAAFLFLLLLFLLCFIQRRSLNDRALLTCAVLVCVAVPFFLPHMHDRYFFSCGRALRGAGADRAAPCLRPRLRQLCLAAGLSRLPAAALPAAHALWRCGAAGGHPCAGHLSCPLPVRSRRHTAARCAIGSARLTFCIPAAGTSPTAHPL